jgi:hypothetical protein
MTIRVVTGDRRNGLFLAISTSTKFEQKNDMKSITRPSSRDALTLPVTPRKRLLGERRKNSVMFFAPEACPERAEEGMINVSKSAIKEFRITIV